MFGESHSESPRLPSPWLSRSSPSPLALSSPGSSGSPPSTPTDGPAKGTRARRRSSLDALELLEDLAEEFDAALDVNAVPKAPPFLLPQMEQVAVTEASAAGLQPEVDHQGNIEYKLKIAMPTSIHRLEKLRTQLKWRLVEGGGTAVYELGVLDNGTLVGLSREEMDQSLKTLAQMLAGLGGGRIQISRVIRIGAESEAAAPPFRDMPAPAFNTAYPSPTHSVFPSFDVLADHDDIAFVASGTPPVVDPLTGETSIFPPPRIRGPTPFPVNRSDEQQAAFRRDKRDARRARRQEAELAAAVAVATSRAGSRSSPSPSSSGDPSRAPTPASSDTPSSAPIAIPPRSFQASYPVAIEPRVKPPKPPKPPRPTTARLRKVVDSPVMPAASTLPLGEAPAVARLPTVVAPAPQPVGAVKPILPQDCDEVRYVVEAIVRKAGAVSLSLSAARRRGESSGSGSRRSEEEAGPSDEDGSPGSTRGGDHLGDESGSSSTGLREYGRGSGQGEGDSDTESLGFEGDEGWNYLDFDLSAAAAAATAAHARRSPHA